MEKLTGYWKDQNEKYNLPTGCSGAGIVTRAPPITPDRLKEIMEKRGNGNWADVDYSLIPVTLEKLENNGLIKKE